VHSLTIQPAQPRSPGGDRGFRRSPVTSAAEVLRRAASWLGVPYSQDAVHTNEFGTYRTDCSGFVSMAWGVPPDPRGGPNTVDLAATSVPIAKDELCAGDALIDANGDRTTRHATLFVAWADAARTRYWAYEQRGGAGTVCRVLPYPDTGYRPYRRSGPRLLRPSFSG
jgi:hypothetical protein